MIPLDFDVKATSLYTDENELIGNSINLCRHQALKEWEVDKRQSAKARQATSRSSANTRPLLFSSDGMLGENASRYILEWRKVLHVGSLDFLFNGKKRLLSTRAFHWVSRSATYRTACITPKYALYHPFLDSSCFTPLLCHCYRLPSWPPQVCQATVPNSGR